MHGFELLVEGVIILVAAIAVVYFFHRLKAGPVLGYLAAGLLVGPHGLRLVVHLDGIQTLAEFGVVFLLFIVGLELSFRRLATMRTEVFGLGSAQVLLTAALVGGALTLLGVGWKAAMVIGFGVALSSTAVVLQILSERGEMSGRMGRISFSILLLQDLAIIPLLAVVPLLGDGGKGATEWQEVAIAAGKAIAALGVILLIGRYLLTPLFRAVAAMHREELFFAVTLLAVLGTAAATQAVGLSLTLGAFLAGLMLAETEFRHQIEVDIRPFQGLLLGLFFMTIGMTIDLAFAVAHWWQVTLLLLGLVAIKAAVIAGLCYAIRIPPATAIRTGLVLAQASEFAFVLISIAARDKIVPADVQQMVLAVAALSMAVTPLLAILGLWLAKRVERVSRIGLAALEQENIDLQKHVVLAGYGRFGRMIARLLDAHRIPYVVLDLDAAQVAQFKSQGVPIHFGDATRPEILWGVGIDRAIAIVLTTAQDPAGETRLVALLHRRLPDIKIIARARDTAHAIALKKSGATDAVPDALASSLHLAQSVIRSFGLPEVDMNQLISQYGQKEAA
ncbi:MAG: monovalent cation:proton antiporter-2 (CPA2) family protein [Rhodospirillaceae bacterium]|nr:monovalent cation:proton antiporter-2 (CPA2) family protein [Rhodospirillaceae bacterium]